MPMPSTRSLRILGKHWKLTAIAIFSLSIAMALGVLSLSISNTFLLLPPAAQAPDRLVMIHTRSAESALDLVSYPDYEYYRDHNHVFAAIAAAPNSVGLDEDLHFENRQVKVLSRSVTSNYFAVMGIRPYLGRLLVPADDQGNANIAVMTYTCWRRLGADPHILGKLLAKHTIIGVTPKEFTGSFFGINGDLLLPLNDSSYPPAWRTEREARRLVLTARLKPGVTRSQAQAEIAALSGQLASAYPKEDQGRAAVVTRATLLPPDTLATAELVIGILMSIVVLVILIACTNVANLLLAVAVGRRQEASVKLALGASKGRLVLEFLSESAVICAAGTLLGYALAAALIFRYSDFTVVLPLFGSYSFALDLRLDATVIGFTLALLLIAILATGLAPARYASSPDLAQILGGEVVIGGTRKRARRNALVVVQVAVCTLVLVGMGLCQRSLSNLRHVDPGFTARNLLAVQVYPENEGYSEARGKQLYLDLRRSVAALPGVESVSLASDLPLLGAGPEPVDSPGGSRKINISHSVVDQDYFATLGIPLLSGRVFTTADREGSPETVIVNHKLAEMFWPGQEAVGKTLTLGHPSHPATVVGVVANGKYLDLDEAALPFLYLSLSRHYQGGVHLIARTKGDPHLWVQPLIKSTHALGLSILTPIPFEDWINVTLLAQRIAAACITALTILGLLLAVIGLFGAVSYSVSERKKELGIRIALGARPAQLLHMVLRQTLWIAGTGILLGLLGGVTATALLRSWLYEVSTIEWTALIPASAAMLAISLLVAGLTARPWITVDPVEAVRHA